MEQETINKYRKELKEKFPHDYVKLLRETIIDCKSHNALNPIYGEGLFLEKVAMSLESLEQSLIPPTN